jgi:cytochrome bd ubiquinol oxidase subunit II
MTELHVFALLGVAVGVYALTAGADFGGGVWDLFASGPRRERQRALIAEAIAPIWEVNHIWMIFVVVVLFSVFPDGFAVVSTALHIPIVLALVGIVLRGSAFVFRAYGLQPDATRARWGQVFALTPVFLGMTLAALSSGAITLVADAHGRVHAGSGFFAGWTGSFALAVGGFTLVLFALLAAVYLAREAELDDQPELADDFRRRALVSEALAFGFAMLVLWRAWAEAPLLFDNLLRAPWSIPAQALTATLAGAAIVSLGRGRLKLARVLVMAQVACVVLGWGLAMDGHLLLPGLRVTEAGAQPAVLAFLPWVLLGGSVLFIPALVWLFRVFKSDPRGWV